MVALGDRVHRSELFSGEPYGDHLHRFGATARAAASAALQLLDVVAGFGLIRPLLDLLVADHAQYRMTKNRSVEVVVEHAALARREGKAVAGRVGLWSDARAIRIRRRGRAHSMGRCAMSALLVGYARCSTDQQDLTAQRDGLVALGVEAERIYVDHGLTGTNRERPGLREALAACRAGDTLVVTKLDRLARSLPDARAIADELTARQISLSLGGSVYDPTDAVGRLLFNVLAMVAEFESDLIRLRTVEGMRVAKAKGRLKGKQPKLSRKQEAHLVSLVHSGEYSTPEVAELFGVGRSTVYRAIERQRVAAKADLAEARSRR